MRHPFLWPVYAICASLVFIVVVGQSREGSRSAAPVTAPLVAAAPQPPTAQPAAPAPTDAPAPTAATTEPPAPTAAPAATLTRARAAIATSRATTPEPTAVPTSAPKPSGPSPEAQAYLEWLQPRMQLVGESATSIGSLLGQFGERQTLLFDKDWQTKIGFQLGLMKGAGEQMRSGERNVPPEARALDANVRSLGNDVVAAADAYAEGLTKLDAQAFTRGQQRLNTGRATIARMTPQVEALKAGR